MVGVKCEDVDFISKTIQIRRSMEYRYSVKEWRIGEPKSKSGYRTIPLTEEAVAILNKQKEKNKWISEISKEWEEFVFLCRKGTPVKNSTYDTALFKICDKAQIPRFSMHILRHTFATRCIEAGMKPKTLQMLLGHSNIGITMNLYVHTTEEEKKKENVTEDVFATPWLRRLLELKDIEELDRDIIVEMIDQITVYENRKLKISYNFGNELEHLFSSVYCEDLEKKAI